MATEVDDVVNEFLQDRVRSSKTTPFIQKEIDVNTPPVSKFFSNQKVLITGVTGFLGKLLLEKLLRSCPDIDTVYVLIRANKKTGQDAETRLKKVLASPVFSQTKKASLEKVVVVGADMSAVGLGLSSSDCQTLRDQVSVVFHVAASLNFSSPLPNALNTNVLGTRRIINLCQLMKHIKALVYVSTAYCNCTQRSVVAEQVYPTTHNTDDLLAKLAQLSPGEVQDVTPSILSGHPNTYSFTKLLAENVILKERGAVPVAIIRPSIVLGTLKEPIEGWVDNINNGGFAFIAGAGKGVFRTILADGSLVADMVPCDLVVNLIIASAPHIAYSDAGMKVFHMTSGTKNPLLWDEYASYTIAGVRNNPCLSPVWYPGAKCRTYMPWAAFKMAVSQYAPALLLYALSKMRGKEHILLGIQNKYVRGMLLSNYFTVNEWKFDTTNTEGLANSLSKSDQDTYNFDVTRISWPQYLEKCSLGVKRFLHKEGPNVDQTGARHMTRSWWIDNAAKVAVFFFVYLSASSLFGTNSLSIIIAMFITCILFLV